jgi:predicted Zn-ribbon and HTH transcriptional regulator
MPKPKARCLDCGLIFRTIYLINERCPGCRRVKLAAAFAVNRPNCRDCGAPVTDFDIRNGLECMLDQRPTCEACLFGALI